MTSVASETWGLVFWRQGAASYAAATGPETRAGSAQVPDEADFVGIQFAVGTSLRIAPASSLVESGIELPVTSRSRFWLGADRWEIPAEEEAEQFVARLVAVGALVRDSLVQEVLDGRPFHGTTRTLERRFRAATGLTRGAIVQIERARSAADRSGQGAPPPMWSCGSGSVTNRTLPGRCVATSGARPRSCANVVVGRSPWPT
jgi:hypothetical protein